VITAKGAVFVWVAASVVLTFLARWGRLACDIVLLFHVKKGAFWKYQGVYWQYWGLVTDRRYRALSNYVEGTGTRWLEFASRLARLSYLSLLSVAFALSIYVFVIVRFHWD
jgi:hypothetical protein